MINIKSDILILLIMIFLIINLNNLFTNISFLSLSTYYKPKYVISVSTTNELVVRDFSLGDCIINSLINSCLTTEERNISMSYVRVCVGSCKLLKNNSFIVLNSQTVMIWFFWRSCMQKV